MSSWRFTLTHDKRTAINSVPSWQDLGNGSGAWSLNFLPTRMETTLGAFQVSNWLADDIINPYNGLYNFLVSIDGSVNGGGGNTCQFTIKFLDSDQNIITSSSAVTVPNAGLVDYPISVDSTDIPAYVMIQVNNMTGSSNTISVYDITFVPDLESIEISEPDGWKGAKIILDRDEQFYSLVERYEGSAGGAFNFYGENNDENGGISFIKSVEQVYGFDANIEFLAEYAPDDVNYVELFNGLLELTGKNEMPDNKMQVPVIRDDFWAKFMSRMDTPVNLSSTTDLDGNPVDPVEPITISLTPQKIQKSFYGYLTNGVNFEEGDEVAQDNYVSVAVDKIETDEISEGSFGYIFQGNIDTYADLPDHTYIAEYAGEHEVDVKFTLSWYRLGAYGPIELYNPTPTGLLVMRMYLQINENTPVALSYTHYLVTGNDATVFSLSTTYNLQTGDRIRIFGQYEPLADDGTFGMTSSDHIVIWGSDENIFTDIDPVTDEPIPTGVGPVPTYIRITAQTIHPETRAQGYLIHDAIHGVLARLGIGTDPFYSEFLGSTFTNAKQYDEDGCGWPYIIIKGLQLRAYTLTEKPFFISFKQLWDGINPILNLGLGYETFDSSPDHQYIRIEEKGYFLEDSVSINFSNVRDISSTYDREHIFKTIKVGYKKWQSEDIAGIDDPQTKKTYATRFTKVGKEMNLESDFIAASLAIETTRRTTREKSVDYKYDNDTFIIALNQDDLSPDVYAPELDENFDSVTNLNNPDTRYNLVLTPLRNFLRWITVLNGCLQSYPTSVYRFVSGEGNYDLITDYSCTSGSFCQAKSCDTRSEKQDIAVNDDDFVDGYLFLPMLYTINIPMEYEEYETIRDNRTKAIGISQSDSGHVPFKIKLLEYDIVNGTASIQAWPKTYFDIQVPEQLIEEQSCAPAEEPNDFTEDIETTSILNDNVSGNISWTVFYNYTGTGSQVGVSSPFFLTTNQTLTYPTSFQTEDIDIKVYKDNNSGIAQGNGTVVFKRDGVVVQTIPFTMGDDLTQANTPIIYTVSDPDSIEVEITEG